MLARVKLSTGNLKMIRFKKYFTTFIPKESELKSFIQYYRKNAHKFSCVNPIEEKAQEPKEFSPGFWSISDLEKIENFPLDYTFGSTIEDLDTVHDLKDFLNKVYLQNVGVEFDHLDIEEEKLWLYENYEKAMSKELTNTELLNSFKILLPAEVRFQA